MNLTKCLPFVLSMSLFFFACDQNANEQAEYYKKEAEEQKAKARAAQSEAERQYERAEAALSEAERQAHNAVKAQTQAIEAQNEAEKMVLKLEKCREGN